MRANLAPLKIARVPATALLRLERCAGIVYKTKMLVPEHVALGLIALVMTAGCQPRRIGSAASSHPDVETPIEPVIISVSPSGSMKAGEPVAIHASVTAVVAGSFETVIEAPELSAAMRFNPHGGPTVTLSDMSPWPAVWHTRLAAGERFDREVSVVIPAPGYYRIIVSVFRWGEPYEIRGRAVTDVVHTELWLWADKNGGRVTRQFDRKLFPRGIRKQPGAFCLETNKACEIPPQEQRLSGWTANIPSFMRVNISPGMRDVRNPRIVRYVVSLSDRDTTRVLSTDSSLLWREYRISSAGDMHIRVDVDGKRPRVRGNGNATIHLRPDLLLEVFIYQRSRSQDPRLYGCQCRGRAAFPLYGEDAAGDSLVIAWDWQTRSRPNPPS